VARSTEPVQNSHRQISSRPWWRRLPGSVSASAAANARRPRSCHRVRSWPAAVGAQRERGCFREGEEPGGKPVSPRRRALPQVGTLRSRRIFPLPKCDFGHCHRLQGQLRIVAQDGPRWQGRCNAHAGTLVYANVCRGGPPHLKTPVLEEAKQKYVLRILRV
jgi:hypothetical protein